MHVLSAVLYLLPPPSDAVSLVFAHLSINQSENDKHELLFVPLIGRCKKKKTNAKLRTPGRGESSSL